jgi:hypothetical protein
MARRQTRKMTRSKAWNQPACYKTGNYIFVYSSLDNVSSAEFYLYSTGNSAFEHSCRTSVHINSMRGKPLLACATQHRVAGYASLEPGPILYLTRQT